MFNEYDSVCIYRYDHSTCVECKRPPRRAAAGEKTTTAQHFQVVYIYIYSVLYIYICIIAYVTL